jgi:hypothetical protein
MKCRRNKATRIQPSSKCRRLTLWLATMGKAAISSGPHPHNSPAAVMSISERFDCCCVKRDEMLQSSASDGDVMRSKVVHSGAMTTGAKYCGLISDFRCTSRGDQGKPRGR